MVLRRAQPQLWLVVYAICCVLVLSFILFEVLDVDGSDFPKPTNTVAVRLAEPPSDGVRRVPTLGHGITAAITPAVVLDSTPKPDPVVCRIESVPAPAPLPRVLLPRASLDDIAHA